MGTSKYTQILQRGFGGGGSREADRNQTGNPPSVDNPHRAPTRTSERRAPLGMDSESCRGNQDTREEEPEAELKDASRCHYDPELTELS